MHNGQPSICACRPIQQWCSRWDNTPKFLPSWILEDPVYKEASAYLRDSQWRNMLGPRGAPTIIRSLIVYAKSNLFYGKLRKLVNGYNNFWGCKYWQRLCLGNTLQCFYNPKARVDSLRIPHNNHPKMIQHLGWGTKYILVYNTEDK